MTTITFKPGTLKVYNATGPKRTTHDRLEAVDLLVDGKKPTSFPGDGTYELSMAQEDEYRAMDDATILEAWRSGILTIKAERSGAGHPKKEDGFAARVAKAEAAAEAEAKAKAEAKPKAKAEAKA